MKKSTLLSLLTAASITLTTAGTYAAWDTLQAKTSSTVTFRNPVTVTVEESYTLNKSEEILGKLPTASGEVSFTISNNDIDEYTQLGDTLTIMPKVTGQDDISVSDFNIEIIDKNEPNTPTLDGSASSGFIDKSLSTTTYTVKVTPIDDSKKIADKEVKIELTATLSKSQQQ